MTAKEYLSQAKYLDLRINSKIEQVAALNDLATKATSVLTGMPHSSNRGTSSMESAITKMVDLEAEIKQDIDKLVDLKLEILEAIKAVQNVEYQTVLEKRYLCFQSWEEIAAAMNYDIRWLYKLHGKALEEIRTVLKL